MQVKKSSLPSLWASAFPNYKGRTYHRYLSSIYSQLRIEDDFRLERNIALINIATREITYLPQPDRFDESAYRWREIPKNTVVAIHTFDRKKDYGVHFIVRPDQERMA